MERWEFWPRIPQLLQKLLLHHHYKLNTKTDGAQGFGFFSERFTCNKLTSKEFASKTKDPLYSSKCLFCLAIKQSDRGTASFRILILQNGRHWESWKHVLTMDYEEDGKLIIHISLWGAGVVRTCHIYKGQLVHYIHSPWKLKLLSLKTKA